MAANPTITDLHIDAALTDISIAFAQRSSFIARMAFPVVPVMKQSNKFFTYDKGDWLRSDAGPRAPGVESPGGGWKISNDNYFCDRDASLHFDVSDPERANADTAIDLDQDGSEYITEQIMLKEEKDWIAANFATGIWDGASSSTDMTGQAAPASTATNFLHWNDVASTPIEDIDGEATAVAEKNGGNKRPNSLFLGPKVWTALKNHPDIVDRIKGGAVPGDPAVVTQRMVAQLLQLERVEVFWGTNTTSQEGQPDTFSFLAGRAALLSYVAPRPGLRVASAGYTFVWTQPGQIAAPTQGVRMKKFRLEQFESDRIEGDHWYDHKVIASSLAAFFATAVST